MSKKNDAILKILNVGSWIIFIGLCIEAGALLFNFIYALVNPVAAQNIYKGLNLSGLYQDAMPHFVGVMSFIVALAVMKAWLFFLVVKIFMKLNLVKPFTNEVASLIEKISYEAIAIAIVSLISMQYTKRLIQSGYDISYSDKYTNDLAPFLMMGAIIFVISQIFRKGIELQNENDLTV